MDDLPILLKNACHEDNLLLPKRRTLRAFAQRRSHRPCTPRSAMRNAEPTCPAGIRLRPRCGSLGLSTSFKQPSLPERPLWTSSFAQVALPTMIWVTGTHFSSGLRGKGGKPARTRLRCFSAPGPIRTAMVCGGRSSLLWGLLRRKAVGTCFVGSSMPGPRSRNPRLLHAAANAWTGGQCGIAAGARCRCHRGAV